MWRQWEGNCVSGVQCGENQNVFQKVVTAISSTSGNRVSELECDENECLSGKGIAATPSTSGNSEVQCEEIEDNSRKDHSDSPRVNKKDFIGTSNKQSQKPV